MSTTGTRQKTLTLISLKKLENVISLFFLQLWSSNCHQNFAFGAPFIFVSQLRPESFQRSTKKATAVKMSKKEKRKRKEKKREKQEIF